MREINNSVVHCIVFALVCFALNWPLLGLLYMATAFAIPALILLVVLKIILAILSR